MGMKIFRKLFFSVFLSRRSEYLVRKTTSLSCCYRTLNSLDGNQITVLGRSSCFSVKDCLLVDQVERWLGKPEIRGSSPGQDSHPTRLPPPPLPPNSHIAVADSDKLSWVIYPDSGETVEKCRNIGFCSTDSRATTR